MPAAISHPLFARFYARFVRTSEQRGGAEHRQKLLAGLSGRVIELGAGSGANFSHYPASVSDVLAVEPEPYLRERARSAATAAHVPISVEQGDADRLPAATASFDAAVVALVLCTVPDQQRALAELFRVIRPGGELRFYEHVLSHSPFEGRIQRAADATFWPRIAGGCHLARDTRGAIEQAGFAIDRCERFAFSPAPLLPPDPHILGVATRPVVAR
jgi:ubiquinone/menaquinone biosynthesis C-methylase UbiE